MKPISYKRIVAYVLDIIIVTVIASLLTYFIPENKEYEASFNEYVSSINEYSKEKINQNEFLQKTNDLVYIMNKESLTVTIVTVVLTIIYFVVFNYFMNGQTLGKKLMKLKIVSNNKKKLTMNNYLIRSLLINSVLMNVLSIIFILLLNKTSYIKVNDITTYLFGAIYIVTFGMILFREDKRGLHDYLANTKVVAVNNYQEEDNNQEEQEYSKDSKIKDAEIIGEK